MAKGNMFLGQAKGKVGSIVFSRAFGQQISRTKPSSVKNPKTRAQNAQRAILATVAKAASIMTPIVDHSFAGVAYGAESVRHFRKINLNQLRALYIDGDPTGYNLTPKGGSVVPNSYIVSQGNLPAFQMAFEGDNFGFKMTNNTVAGGAAVSVSSFLQGYPYLQGGDQLTLVKLVLTSGSLASGDAKFVFMYDRIVFAPNAFENGESTIIEASGLFAESKLDLTKTTNTSMLMLGAIGDQEMLTADADNVYAAALILSREVNGVWQRSTQEMGLTHDSDVQDIEAAIASYGASASESADDEYLNQADEDDNVQEGVSKAYMQVSVSKNGTNLSSTKVNKAETKTGTGEFAAYDVLDISAVAYEDANNPLVTCEIVDVDGNAVAHAGAGRAVTYSNAIIGSSLAGVYKVVALYRDGTKAEMDFTVTWKV